MPVFSGDIRTDRVDPKTVKLINDSQVLIVMLNLVYGKPEESRFQQKRQHLEMKRASLLWDDWQEWSMIHLKDGSPSLWVRPSTRTGSGLPPGTQ